MTMLANDRRSIVARAQRRTDQAGAAMVEYSLLLFAVLICAAGAIKTIGPTVACAGQNATDSLVGGFAGGSCGGPTAEAGGASGGGAGDANGGGAGDVVGGGSDDGAGSGSGSGQIASAGGDDGTGGYIGGSGSSSSSGSGSATSGSGSASGGGSSGSAGSDSSVSSGAASFASQVAGTSPKQIDLTLAKLSADVYGDDNAKNQQGADGFRPLTSDELAKAGITQSMLRDDISGFVADVYTDGKGDYVVAYRGTASRSGMATDIKQGLGFKTAQYSEAERLGKAAKAAYGSNVVLTGHSLGGSEAAAVAAATGLPAVTFNANGVADNTLVAEGVIPADARQQANNGQVRRYQVEGDILTGSQEATKWVSAQPLGRPIVIQDPNPLVTAAHQGFTSFGSTTGIRAGELHEIGSVLGGMENRPVVYGGGGVEPAQYQFQNPNPS